MGKSELQVVTLALQDPSNSVALLDDLTARKTAEELGLSITGTVGILILAKKRGLLGSIAPLLDQMVSHGFWMSDSLRLMVERAGEL